MAPRQEGHAEPDRTPRHAVSDLRDGGVLVLPELPGPILLLAPQQCGLRVLPGSPGFDEPGHQGPQTLLPPQHPRESVGWVGRRREREEGACE